MTNRPSTNIPTISTLNFHVFAVCLFFVFTDWQRQCTHGDIPHKNCTQSKSLFFSLSLAGTSHAECLLNGIFVYVSLSLFDLYSEQTQNYSSRKRTKCYCTTACAVKRTELKLVVCSSDRRERGIKNARNEQRIQMKNAHKMEYGENVLTDSEYVVNASHRQPMSIV